MISQRNGLCKKSEFPGFPDSASALDPGNPAGIRIQSRELLTPTGLVRGGLRVRFDSAGSEADGQLTPENPPDKLH